MSASERKRGIPRNAAALLCALLIAACDDPTAVRSPEPTPALVTFMILDADAEIQPLLVHSTGSAQVVHGLTGKLEEVATGAAVTVVAEDTLESKGVYPCIGRYGTLTSIARPPRCLDFELAVDLGTEYSLTVSAQGWPTVTGTTRVPGDFVVREAKARGDPPDSAGLEARWTRSEGAYRYLVAVRSEVPPWNCGPHCSQEPDRRGWYIATTDTVLSTVIPAKAAEELAGGRGPWFVDVYAVDKALYEYLTTGAAGDLFPIPPMQNVKGGYGAVGSWVRRSVMVRRL